MAKKLGKALLFTAVASAVVAGGMAIYNKYKASTDDFDDDFLDFDDEDDDFDDDSSDEEASDDNKTNREYVSIPRDDAANNDESKVNVEVKIADTLVDDDDEEDADINTDDVNA